MEIPVPLEVFIQHWFQHIDISMQHTVDDEKPVLCQCPGNEPIREHVCQHNILFIDSALLEDATREATTHLEYLGYRLHSSKEKTRVEGRGALQG